MVPGLLDELADRDDPRAAQARARAAGAGTGRGPCRRRLAREHTASWADTVRAGDAAPSFHDAFTRAVRALRDVEVPADAVDERAPARAPAHDVPRGRGPRRRGRRGQGPRSRCSAGSRTGRRTRSTSAVKAGRAGGRWRRRPRRRARRAGAAPPASAPGWRSAGRARARPAGRGPPASVGPSSAGDSARSGPGGAEPVTSAHRPDHLARRSRRPAGGRRGDARPPAVVVRAYPTLVEEGPGKPSVALRVLADAPRRRAAARRGPAPAAAARRRPRRRPASRPGGRGTQALALAAEPVPEHRGARRGRAARGGRRARRPAHLAQTRRRGTIRDAEAYAALRASVRDGARGRRAPRRRATSSPCSPRGASSTCELRGDLQPRAAGDRAGRARAGRPRWCTTGFVSEIGADRLPQLVRYLRAAPAPPGEGRGEPARATPTSRGRCTTSRSYAAARARPRRGADPRATPRSTTSAGCSRSCASACSRSSSAPRCRSRRPASARRSPRSDRHDRGSLGPPSPATSSPQLTACAVVTTGSSFGAPVATCSGAPTVAVLPVRGQVHERPRHAEGTHRRQPTPLQPGQAQAPSSSRAARDPCPRRRTSRSNVYPSRLRVLHRCGEPAEGTSARRGRHATGIRLGMTAVTVAGSGVLAPMAAEQPAHDSARDRRAGRDPRESATVLAGASADDVRDVGDASWPRAWCSRGSAAGPARRTRRRGRRRADGVAGVGARCSTGRRRERGAAGGAVPRTRRGCRDGGRVGVTPPRSRSHVLPVADAARVGGGLRHVHTSRSCHSSAGAGVAPDSTPASPASSARAGRVPGAPTSRHAARRARCAVVAARCDALAREAEVGRSRPRAVPVAVDPGSRRAVDGRAADGRPMRVPPVARGTADRRRPRGSRARSAPMTAGARRRLPRGAVLRRRRPAVRALPRRRVGRARARRARAVRADRARGVPVRAGLDHDPAQAPGVPGGVRGVRPRGGRAVRRATTSSGCSATRASCATAPRSRPPSPTPARCSPCTSRGARSTSSCGRTRPEPTAAAAHVGGRAGDAHRSRGAGQGAQALRFRFVGPTTAYAAMQACGVVDDHLADCLVVRAEASPRPGGRLLPPG